MLILASRKETDHGRRFRTAPASAISSRTSTPAASARSGRRLSLYESIILGYRVLLGALVVVIMLRGIAPMKRTVLTLLVVYGLQLAYAGLIGYNTGWSIFMFCVDALACRIITWQPAGKWQGYVGLSFILQMGVHAGKAGAELLGYAPDINLYWWVLTALAFLQLALVGGWWLRGTNNNSNGHRSRGDQAPAQARAKSAEG